MATAWFALHRQPISPTSAYRFETRYVEDVELLAKTLREFYAGTGISVEMFENEADFLRAFNGRAR
jgi:hypothetical protein